MTSETEFEMVQRHVRGSAKAIERQQDIILRLSALGVSVDMILLANSARRFSAETRSRGVG